MENIILDENTAEKIKPVLERLLKSYCEKDSSLSTEDWLVQEMERELSDYAKDQIKDISHDIISEVSVFNKNLAELNEACERISDLSNEQWLADKVAEMAKDTPVGELGEKILQAERILDKYNDQSMSKLAKELGWQDLPQYEAVPDIPIPKEWNTHSLKAVTKAIGHQAVLSGAHSMVANAGMQIAHKLYNGEKIETNDIIVVAVRTGADEGVKVATSAALKICAEKGLIPVVAKGTPARVLVNIACTGIENIKILQKFADGEISGLKAMDLIARTSTVSLYSMAGSLSGAEFGAAVGTVFGPVGMILGGLIGGTVGYLAGSAVGRAIYGGVKAIGSAAVSVAKAGWSAVKSAGSTFARAVKSTVSTFFS